MTRIAYFDCVSGAAGDMIMGALVDAGAPFEALRDGLHGLDLGGWELVRQEVRRGAFRATKIDVEIDAAAHQHHRTLGDILAILERSRLPAAVAERARRIFERLAAAEARVHGTTPEHVHFHDVGAVDAIVERWSEWRRAVLPREMVTLTTTYGPIPFKVSRLEGRVVTVTPEFADVARIAREKSLPVREVLDQARAEGRRLLSGR